MLKEITGFINDAIGIDPDDCGCTDCGIGDSIPLGETHRIEELLKAHFEEGREIVNRTGSTIVAYRTRQGDYEWEWVSVTGSGTSFDVIAPEESYFAYSEGEGTVVSDDDTPEDEREGAVDVEDDTLMNELAEKHFRHGEVVINRTSQALLMYATRYGEFGYVPLDTAKDDPVTSVLPYH
jgi:hypothetical protein